MTAKYVLILPDGAADEPLEQFDGKTAIEAAHTPHMDAISMEGRLGLVQTIPNGFEPGSDVAQMSLLGYDPATYYTGRAPIEAVAQDIPLGLADWVFRCNLVTLSDGKMADHSAGHISTPEAQTLIHELSQHIKDDRLEFYTGVSYRHLMVCRGIDFDCYTYPPHDHIGKAVEKLLPRGKGADLLKDLIQQSMGLFEDHAINKIRQDLGENAVSSIWLWGQGRKTMMDSFKKQFGLTGAAITAVDLVRGLAKLVGFDLIEVEGATGFYDTNYAGKAQAAIEALKTHDFVFVHIEGPDEAGHQGNAPIKVKAIERIDKEIVGPVVQAIKQYDQWRVMVLPDHPTPVMTGAHTSDPVPFAMAGTGIKPIMSKPFSETSARESGFRIEKGHELMEYFIKSSSR
ncbi:MAG: cofactor-independent phosphoglycerate mutase [Phycisphaerae bacterium]|nr:cofactor-independent phosphoglycerate mutase [Phycisphaerae bacterium]